MAQMRSVAILIATCVVIGTVAVGGGLAVTSTSAQDIPSIPANYYPTVSLSDGELDQPVLVEAVADGEVQASVITTASGGHNGSGLEVQEPDNAEVSFRVGGSETIVQTVTWSSGPHQVSLEVSKEDLNTYLGVSITEQTSPVEVGEEASVEAEITNTEGVQATQTIELQRNQNETIDSQQITVPIGESQPVTLTWEPGENDTGDNVITVASENESDQTTITVEEPPSEDDEESSEGSDGSGGGGAGGGGVGTGGGGSDADNGPTTIQDVRDTTTLIEPTTDSETPLADADPETPGITVEPAAADSVRRITFTNEELTGTVPITEYSSPPQTLVNTIVESVNSDVSELENNTLNIIFAADISPTVNATEDSSATVEFGIDRSKVENPEQLTVIKESYSEETQSEQWRQLETTIVETTDEEVIVEAEVDAFSLFTVAEITGTEESQVSSEENSSSAGDDGSTDDGIPGFGVVVALVGLIGTALLATRRQN